VFFDSWVGIRGKVNRAVLIDNQRIHDVIVVNRAEGQPCGAY
jgi:hypothetical protein